MRARVGVNRTIRKSPTRRGAHRGGGTASDRARPLDAAERSGRGREHHDGPQPGPATLDHRDERPVGPERGERPVRRTGGVDALALTHLDLVGAHRLRLCDGYDWTDRLPTGPPGDLDRQAALTAKLLASRPRYTADPEPDPAAWVDAVEAALGVPVWLTSDGPTAADKRAGRTGCGRYTRSQAKYLTTIGVAESKSVPPYQRVSPAH